jgi:oligopeptide transport system ATP-binding protein
MSDDDIVTVESLRKVYPLRRGADRSAAREIVAVDNVSFALPIRGALAIVGESGSGKTTTARMILGLEQPTAGLISVAGRPRVSKRLTRRERRTRGREVQIVFQDPYVSLDPRQTASNCLDEVLRFQFGWDRARRRARAIELLGQVGLGEEFADRLPRSMSGGQRQRIAIARALAAEPKVVVLDEAVSALDVSIQAQVLNLLADLRAQTSVSYIFISHDLGVVRQVSEQVIVMRAGKVVESGQTDEVLDDPKSDYTKLLLSAVPRPGWKPQRRDFLSAASDDRDSGSVEPAH